MRVCTIRLTPGMASRIAAKSASVWLLEDVEKTTGMVLRGWVDEKLVLTSEPFFLVLLTRWVARVEAGFSRRAQGSDWGRCPPGTDPSRRRPLRNPRAFGCCEDVEKTTGMVLRGYHPRSSWLGGGVAGLACNERDHKRTEKSSAIEGTRGARRGCRSRCDRWLCGRFACGRAACGLIPGASFDRGRVSTPQCPERRYGDSGPWHMLLPG